MRGVWSWDLLDDQPSRATLDSLELLVVFLWEAAPCCRGILKDWPCWICCCLYFFACTTCILLLVHYLLILIATFCVFCLVAAVVFFASISLLVHCFVAFVCACCVPDKWVAVLCVVLLSFINIIILYSILSFVSWSSATATIFGNESLVWFLLISQRKTHQIVCIATWTGVLNYEACLLFFSCLFFNILLSYLMILYLISMFALVLQYFKSFSLFLLLLLFFFLPFLFLVLLYPFCSAFEVSLFLPCSYAWSSTCLFLSLFY